MTTHDPAVVAKVRSAMPTPYRGGSAEQFLDALAAQGLAVRPADDKVVSRERLRDAVHASHSDDLGIDCERLADAAWAILAADTDEAAAQPHREAGE